MTVHGAFLFMLIFLILYALHGSWQNVNRCTYCGKVAGHDEDCPRGRI